MLPQIEYTIFKNPVLFFSNDQSNETNCINTTFITSDVVSVVSNEQIYSEDLVIFYLKSHLPVNILTDKIYTYFNTSYFFKIENHCDTGNYTRKYKCGFWDLNELIWNTTGCNYTQISSDVHKCTCNHMTHFGVLVVII